MKVIADNKIHLIRRVIEILVDRVRNADALKATNPEAFEHLQSDYPLRRKSR